MLPMEKKQWIVIHSISLFVFDTWIWNVPGKLNQFHNIDVILTMMVSKITSLTVVYSIVCSGVDQRKHQSSASLIFVWRIHRDRWSPRTKGQWRGKCFHLMTSSWSQMMPWRPVLPGRQQPPYWLLGTQRIFSFHEKRFDDLRHQC